MCKSEKSIVSLHGVGILLILFFVAACTPRNSTAPAPQSSAAQLDPGSVVGTVYTNNSLGLRLRFPEKMVVEPRSEVEALAREGAALLNPDDPGNSATFKENIGQERIVFSLSTPESETSTGGMLNLSIKKDPGGDLEAIVVRSLSVISSSRNTRIKSAPIKEIIGGVDFYTFVIATESDGTPILTRIRTTRRKGHLLTFSTSYIVEREAREIDEVVKNAEFFDS